MNPEQMNESLGKHFNPPEGQMDDGIDAEVKQAAENARIAPDPSIPRAERRSLADYEIDHEKKNVLIDGDWLIRGGIAMIVSTTGSGKSILQTQMALCFNRGVDCFGLHPVRPIRSWIFQSEDSDRRIARDRIDLLSELKKKRPVDSNGNPIDWDEAMRQTTFINLKKIKQVKTGASFLEIFENELRDSPPDLAFINPLYGYMGGDLNSGKDVRAFFKSGILDGKETPGIEWILEQHNIGAIIFAHTGKPPSEKERKSWLTDSFSSYRACGSSDIANAVRSILVFLPCPKHAGVYIFTAAKNGFELGWKNHIGNATLRSLYQHGENFKHYWQDVPKEEWGQIFKDAGIKDEDECTVPKVKPSEPEPDKEEIALRVFRKFEELVLLGEAESKVLETFNDEMTAYAGRWRIWGAKLLTRNTVHKLMTDLGKQGKIKILPKGAYKSKGMLCGLPEMVEAFEKAKLLDVEPNSIDNGKPVPSFDNHEPPAFGRSKKFNDAANKTARKEEQCTQLEGGSEEQV